MSLWHNCLLLLSFTVPLALDFATCTADESSTRAPLRLDAQVRTNTTHELPLDLVLSLAGFSWATRPIIERHEFALDILQ